MQERRSSGDFVLERRRTPRIPLRVGVSYSLAGAEGNGSTENLTVHGFFLRTDAPAALDAAVELSLDLPDDGGPVKANGRVVRIARRKDEPLGFAVEFEQLEESARQRIAVLVEQARIDVTGR
jgi:hypothetical protein